MTAETSAKIANLSFLGVVAVVLGHVGWRAVEGSAAWARFGLAAHVVSRAVLPFFFCVSGYFLAQHADERGWWRSAVVKRIKSLIVPFLAWTFIYLAEMFVVDVALNVQAGREPFANLRGVWGDVRLFFGLDPFSYPALVPLWYVRNLFLLVMLSPVILWLVDRLRVWWLAMAAAAYLAVACLACLGHLSFANGIGAVLSRCFSVEGLLGFSVGVYLARRRGASALRLAHPAVAVLAGVVGTAFVLMVSFSAAGRCGYLLEHLAMLLLAYAAWAGVSGRAWPRWLVGAAFPLFLTHPVLFDIACGVAKGAGWPVGSAAFRWGMFVFSVVGAIGLAALAHRGGRLVSKILFGGR